MRRFVSFAALAALAAPSLAAAQIAEVDLPPSDIASADPGYDDSGYGESDSDEYAADAPRDRGAGALADILDDPDRQEDIADAMSGIMRALLTIRVGPILDAARQVDPRANEDYGRVDPETTIGDIASRGDPDYEDRLEDGIRGGTAVSGTMVREFAKMMPMLISIAKDLGAQAEKAIKREQRR